MEAPAVEKFLERIRAKSTQQAAKDLDMPEENVPLLYISMMILYTIMDAMGAEQIWSPGVTLSDGIAYEYAEKHKIIASTHDFEKDIIACAQNISKRYRGSRKRSETLEKIALTILTVCVESTGLAGESGCFYRYPRFFMTAESTSVW